MDSLKAWLIETFGPSAIRGAILGVGGLVVAHSGIMSKFGIFYDAVQHIITIHLTTASDALIPILIGLGAGFIKTGHVTLTNAINKGGTPQ